MKIFLYKNSIPFDMNIKQGHILGVTGLDGQGGHCQILCGINKAFDGKVVTFDNNEQKLY